MRRFGDIEELVNKALRALRKGTTHRFLRRRGSLASHRNWSEPASCMAAFRH